MVSRLELSRYNVSLMAGYWVKQFLKDAESIVRNTSAESKVLRHLKPLITDLVHNPDSVPKAAFTPRKDRFANNLIYMPKDKVFSVNGAVWLPGQTTPIHDHLT